MSLQRGKNTEEFLLLKPEKMCYYFVSLSVGNSKREHFCSIRSGLRATK